MINKKQIKKINLIIKKYHYNIIKLKNHIKNLIKFNNLIKKINSIKFIYKLLIHSMVNFNLYNVIISILLIIELLKEKLFKSKLLS
jgi:hypothetical protein